MDNTELEDDVVSKIEHDGTVWIKSLQICISKSDL